MTTHAHHHHVARQAGGRAQLGRDQDATGAIEIDIGGIAEKNALPGARGNRPFGNFFAAHFPHGTREEQQATIRMLGQGDAAFALQKQGVAMPGWNSHPAFGIEIERRRALKHPEILFVRYAVLALYLRLKIPTNKHFFTQAPTLVDAPISGQAIFRGENKVFFNEVKDLAHYVDATRLLNISKN